MLLGAGRTAKQQVEQAVYELLEYVSMAVRITQNITVDHAAPDLNIGKPHLFCDSILDCGRECECDSSYKLLEVRKPSILTPAPR